MDIVTIVSHKITNFVMFFGHCFLYNGIALILLLLHLR